MPTTITAHATTIITAYLGNHKVAADQIPGIIGSVHSAFTNLGKPIGTGTAITLRKPAVPVRNSIRPDKIICLECGFSGSMIKRHLTTAHGLSVDDYRARWGLTPDYPVVAPAYAAKRSSLAKRFGLGHSRR